MQRGQRGTRNREEGSRGGVHCGVGDEQDQSLEHCYRNGEEQHKGNKKSKPMLLSERGNKT